MEGSQPARGIESRFARLCGGRGSGHGGDEGLNSCILIEVRGFFKVKD